MIYSTATRCAVPAASSLSVTHICLSSAELMHGTTMPPRHGLENHNIRNSRDLTRKARPVSVMSRSSSVSSGGDSRGSEELHVVTQSKCRLRNYECGAGSGGISCLW
jgi:hypothetical protein